MIIKFHRLERTASPLKRTGCSVQAEYAAMESTGIYWMPIYEILEDDFSGDITLLVVNARHMKNVPGKKTDMRDSEWISTLLRAGLLNGSFIPEKRIREFRDLNRYRKSVIRDITSQKNRIEKFLQSSGFRLSFFISDFFGAAGHPCEAGDLAICHIQYAVQDQNALFLLRQVGKSVGHKLVVDM